MQQPLNSFFSRENIIYREVGMIYCLWVLSTGLCLQQIQTSAAAPQVSLTMIPPVDLSNIAPRDQWYYPVCEAHNA